MIICNNLTANTKDKPGNDTHASNISLLFAALVQPSNKLSVNNQHKANDSASSFTFHFVCCINATYCKYEVKGKN